MKLLINDFYARTSRYEPLLILIPFACWVFCFLDFFNGRLTLQDDAVSYAQHIIYYTNNLSRGVYPLWDPTWFSGAPNDFFLRRIGDVNPLLWLMVMLHWAGVSPQTAYVIFLGLYYLLAGWAFYLIARFLLADCFYAFSAYILFLFSSWGSEVFYNYIIIIFVPIIWFFYFLLCFAKEQRQGPFLGLCFCLGLIVSTYIPFFFLTMAAIFCFFYALFYKDMCLDFARNCLAFFKFHKVFSLLCAIFLVCSCLPVLLFYHESKSGEFVLPGRHAGADSPSAVAVGINNVASGDIVNHGYFDRIFDDQAHLDMGDIYMPYLFFLLLLVTFFARSSKLVYFFLFNVLALCLITVTSAAHVHRFLYEHVIIFKFIRNIYYFFWLGILPMSILLSVTAFKSLLNSMQGPPKRMLWLGYVFICHFLFIVFLLGHHGVLWGAWVSAAFSWFYFLAYFFCDRKVSYLAGFVLFLTSVFVQSAQVYKCLDDKLFKEFAQEEHYESTHQNSKMTRLNLYYASDGFSKLVNTIDPRILENYRSHPFIFYDNVVPYRGVSREFIDTLQATMDKQVNIVFLSSTESSGLDYRKSPLGNIPADFNPAASGQLSVLYHDSNTWVLRARVQNSRFLLISDNYNSHWHAFIDGRRARLLRANVAFKGFWVPCGESTLVLRYSTPSDYFFRYLLMALFLGAFFYLIYLQLFQGIKAKKQVSS